MKIKPSIKWTPAQWYNSSTYKVSYKRNYKAASSTIVAMLGNSLQEPQPIYDKQFSVIREPIERTKSIYKQMFVVQPGFNLSFTEWLEDIYKYGFDDKHQFPQSFWLEGTESIVIFKLDDLNGLLKYIGYKGKSIPHLNKRDMEITPTKRDLDIIKELYYTDIAIYKNL